MLLALEIQELLPSGAGGSIGANVLGLLFPLNLDVQGGVLRVQATAAGEFNGYLYDVGDVFDIPFTAFSDSTVDYLAAPQQPPPPYLPPPPPLASLAGGPLYGWMKIVPSTTPLTNPTPQVYDWTSARRTVF